MKPGVLRDEEHRVEVTPEVAAGRRYTYLPVEVPAGTAELRVEYGVEGSGRIDIGIFESSESPPAIAAFRGWSGSARESFLIQRSAATPGYLSGPLGPGRWHVVLGLYLVNEPLVIRVRVQAGRRRSMGLESSADRAAELPAARKAIHRIFGIPESPPPNPLEAEGWIRGDLHCHTSHSNDAEKAMTPAEAVAAAEALGMGFLALTEHNTTSQWRDSKCLQQATNIALIPAQEVTTYRGHFNAFGIKSLLEFRTLDDAEVAQIAKAAADSGAVLSVNHPKRVGPPWEYSVTDAFSAIEAWQAPWPWMNWESMARWTRLLDEGRRIAAIGGSDLHDLRARRGHMLGTPTTWIRPGGDRAGGVKGVVQSIAAAHCIISEGPAAPVPYLESCDSADDWSHTIGCAGSVNQALRVRVLGEARGLELRFRWTGGGEWRHGISAADEVVNLPRLPSDTTWARVELWRPASDESATGAQHHGQLVAVTNPVWLA